MADKKSSGAPKESMVSHPEGGQTNENVAGFRARKEEMHKQDGKKNK